MPKMKAPRLTEEELRSEVAELLSLANEAAKPRLSHYGLSHFQVNGKHLILDPTFNTGKTVAGNLVEVAFFNDEYGDRVKQLAWEDTLGLIVEVAGPAFSLSGPIIGQDISWRSVILEGLPTEEWPEAKFRLVPKEEQV